MLLHDPFYAFQSISVQGWIFLSCKESSVLLLWYLVRTVDNLHKKHLAALLDFYLDLPGGSFFPFPVFFPFLRYSFTGFNGVVQKISEQGTELPFLKRQS